MFLKSNGKQNRLHLPDPFYQKSEQKKVFLKC